MQRPPGKSKPVHDIILQGLGDPPIPGVRGVAKIRKRKYGEMLVLGPDWDLRTIEQLAMLGCEGLELNYVYGFEPDSLEFLSPLADSLKLLRVCLPGSFDESAIAELKKLEWLEVDYAGRRSSPLDGLNLLRGCHIDGRGDYAALFSNAQLESLSVCPFLGADMSDFIALKGLRQLHLREASQLGSLKGIAGLSELQQFHLYSTKKLRDLRGIEECQRLRDVVLNGLKGLRDCSAIGGLVTLEGLELIDLGPIDSIEFVSSLKTLGSIAIGGSTKVLDGNLDVLCDLASLQKVRVRHRSSYTEGYRSRQ